MILQKIDKQELLDHPPNVTDSFNIMEYNPTIGKINSPLIILKYSDSIPPDTITISSYRIKVQNYQASSRICFKCLKYGHNEKVCRKYTNIHRNMKDMSSCPNIKKCIHCEDDHITFDKGCTEYKFQKDILNTTYSNKKKSFRIAKFILRPNDKSYAASIKTNLPVLQEILVTLLNLLFIIIQELNNK